MSIKSINPATGEVIKVLDELNQDQVYAEIDKAYNAFQEWKKTDFKHRSGLMKKLSKVLKDEKFNYGKILTMEMGKPLKQAVAEVEKCARACDYYAENAEKILKREIIKSDASESYVEFDPIGVILAIMPWNFPYWQVFRFAAPALMAGNVGLLKHSSNVPMSALAIQEMFEKAGFPPHTFRTLLIGSSMVEDVIRHPKVVAATLTGSEGAGKRVAATAGECLKKTVLELGGSDPFIVLADADIDKAAEWAVKARIVNNGESCIAAKRFIVVKEVASQFEKKFVERMSALKVGDPMDERNEVGPMAREDLLNDLHKMVQQSIEKGAKLLTGGKRVEIDGYYYEPTILSNVKKGMAVYDYETFGPVAALIVADSETDAIRIANDTPYGLGANIWTKNTDHAKELAPKIEAGMVYVNGQVVSDPRLPFGGVKASGYGRELSHYGIKEFVNIKTVYIT